MNNSIGSRADREEECEAGDEGAGEHEVERVDVEDGGELEQDRQQHGGRGNIGGHLSDHRDQGTDEDPEHLRRQE